MIQFSICIPNYNYGAYIGETIESVLNQSYPNFEIVIVDNASTDDSWEVIESYVRKDKRITAYRNSYNVGFAPNLDKAASKAGNEYIIMLSSDDTMNPKALESYLQIIEKKEINNKNLLLCSAVNFINSKGEITGALKRTNFHSIQPRGKYSSIINDDQIYDFDGLSLFKEVYPKFSVPGPFLSTLYSKNLYEKVGGYSSLNYIGPDAHFAYKCLLSEAEVIFIDKPLFNYRIHQSGQLNTSSKNRNINVLIDRYVSSNSYSDEQLLKAGLVRNDFKIATLKKDCIEGAFRELKNGNWVYACQHISFGIAAYPYVSLRYIPTYLMILILLLGPFGIYFSRLAFYLVKKIN